MHRFREEEENIERRQDGRIELVVASSAGRESDKNFFQMLLREVSSSSNSSNPVEIQRREDLYTSFVVVGIGRDLREVME